MIKVIIISGTSKGLGQEILLELCRNTSYNFATINRSSENEELEYFLQFRGDISNYRDVISFYQKIYDKWGKVDILINNAATVGKFKALTTYDKEEIDQSIDINIKGTYFMTQEAIRLMHNDGFIINIGSTRALTGAPDKSLYCTTKFALRGLNQCINTEYNEHNIYSTLICPGNLDYYNEASETTNRKITVQTVSYLINNNIRNIPELRIGGKL